MTLFIWLLLLNPAHAQIAVERLCFSSDAEALRAKPLVEVVLIKSQDRVEVDGRCLNATVDEKRSEVLRRWVKTRLPQAEFTFSSADVSELTCDMLATKKTRKQKEQTSVEVDGRSFQVSTGDDKSQQTEEHQLKVSSGGTATLMVGTSELKITCTATPSGNYRLKFAQNYIAPPPLVVGQVLVPQPQPENVTSLTTEIDARRNVPVNIGQISKDLNQKQRDVSLQEGVNLGTTTGEDTTEWSLVIR